MEVGGQPEGEGSLLLPCMCQGLNLGHQTRYQRLPLLMLSPNLNIPLSTFCPSFGLPLAYQLIPVLAEGPNLGPEPTHSLPNSVSYSGPDWTHL